MSVLQYFYKILWCLLHFTIDLTVLAHKFYFKIKSVLKSGAFFTLFYTSNDNRKKWKKIPRHLTVLFNKNEYPSHVNLSKLIIWSISHGIPYISFYDHWGQLALNYEKLQMDVEMYLKGMKLKHHIIWHRNSSYTNGFREPKVHVKVLQPCDSHSSLVLTCRELSDKSLKRRVTIEDVDSNQKSKFEFPDPCLAIYFGDYLNLRGYPPWQIRLTEFLQVSNYDITYNDFFNLLNRFNKCEQRVGK